MTYHLNILYILRKNDPKFNHPNKTHAHQVPRQRSWFPGCLENLDLVTNLETSSTLFSDKLCN